MAQGLLKSNRDRDGLAAALLYNLGDLENGIYEVQEEWQTQHDNFRALEASLEQAGLRRLNGPNLIRNNWWTNRDMPSSAVIVQEFTVPVEDATAAASPLTFTVTNAAITTAYVLHGKWTGNSEAVPWSSITATFAAGSATITVAARSGAHGAVNIKVALCTVANVPVPYGNASRISGTSYPYLDSIRSGFYPGDDSEDGCSVTVATLTGDDIITELDGEVFNRALQFSITANTAWGNTEELHFCRPQTNKYTQGSECKDYGQIPEMIPGETYSISFIGRMISGTKAWARCAWGGVNGGLSTFNVDGKCGVSDWIEINGTAWKRYTWPFVFQPTGDWYTETSAVEDGVTKVTRAYNWFKKVSVGISRKFTGVVQLTGFRLVKGKTWITDTYDDINQGLDAVKDRVTALETGAESMLSNFAESETATATANHAVGDLFVMGGKLYKATAAISAGETITVGTNVTAVKVAEMLAGKAEATDTVLNTTLSLGRKADTTVGTNSFAFGANVEASNTYAHAEGALTVASGYCSHACGYSTIAAGKYQHVFGKYNVEDGAIEEHDSTANYVIGDFVYTHYNYYDAGTKRKTFVYECIADNTGDSVTSGELPASHWVKREDLSPGGYSSGSAYPEVEYRKHIEIVGKGTSSARSNARTLDWAGNEALAGGLTLGLGTTDETTITAAQLKQLLALLS